MKPSKKSGGRKPGRAPRKLRSAAAPCDLLPSQRYVTPGQQLLELAALRLMAAVEAAQQAPSLDLVTIGKAHAEWLAADTSFREAVAVRRKEIDRERNRLDAERGE